MSSRSQILSKIKANKLKVVSLPEINPEHFMEQTDLLEHFKKVTQSVGGTLIPDGIDDIHTFLLEQYPGLKMRYSALYGAGKFNTVKLEMIKSPHELEKLDLLVLEGNFGVAENAAIWLQDEQIPVRVLPFITKHLVIKLDQNKIIPDLHSAYTKLSNAVFDFGVLLSGPSKTADIEQVLVVGAQGALGVSVWLI